METVAFAAVHADGPANGALLTISSNATMIENLPVDIMVRISMFLKLPCRIRFASAASKPRHELIFQDAHPLWHEINFCALPYATKKRLTDEMLSSLVIRVNAKSVTRAINLEDCEKKSWDLVFCHCRGVANFLRRLTYVTRARRQC